MQNKNQESPSISVINRWGGEPLVRWGLGSTHRARIKGKGLTLKTGRKKRLLSVMKGEHNLQKNKEAKGGEGEAGGSEGKDLFWSNNGMQDVISIHVPTGCVSVGAQKEGGGNSSQKQRKKRMGKRES